MSRPFLATYRGWRLTVLALIAMTTALTGGACGPDAPNETTTTAHHPGESDHHEHGDAPGGTDHHGHDEKNVIVLTDEALADNRIVVEKAAIGVVQTEIDLPGEIVLNADRVAHVVPRFPGIVQQVNKRLGDRVRAGEVLAVIQSNVSVSPYDLTSMIDGSVIEKHLTLGEYVRDDADVFIVADLSTVWVSVSVYARFLADVRPGQTVRITSPGLPETATGKLDYVGPLVGESTRTGVARLVLPNPDGRWQPGLFVTAHITVTESRGKISVPDDAVQTIEGTPVVFVRDGAGFVPRPVALGQRGGGRVALLRGLEPGEEFVAKGSFIFKADLGKSQAEHSH